MNLFTLRSPSYSCRGRACSARMIHFPEGGLSKLSPYKSTRRRGLSKLSPYNTVWRMAGVVLAALLVSPIAQAVTLDEAVVASLDNSPTLQAAASRVDAAQAMLRQAKSYYYPSIGLAAQYGITDNPPQAFMMQMNQKALDMMDPSFDPNNPGDVDNLRGSVTAQWRVFDLQRDAGKHMARFGAQASEEALAAAQNQLVYEVTRGFYGVLQAKAFEAVQAESVKSIEESLRIAQERFNAGGAVKTDVLTLETQQAAAQEDLIKARNGMQLAVAALNAAIGDEIVSLENIESPDVDLNQPPAECTDPLAFENRPELRAAVLMRRIKEQDLKKAKGGYAPTLSAFASYDADSDVSSGFEESYTAGVAAEINIFDGARTRSKVASATADLNGARANEEKARLNLKLDLTQAYLGTQDAWQRLEVMSRSVESATEAQRIIREQYEQGAADISILLQTQVGVTAMQTRSVAAEYDFLIAQSNLKRAKGLLGDLGIKN
jgi:outer membrane protein